MPEDEPLSYIINDPIELNLSYMPFIAGGGLFIPTSKTFSLGTQVAVDLQLPGKKESISITGKVVWIIPPNALHHVLTGIGIQFTDTNAQTIRTQLEALLDRSMEVGGYTYGFMAEAKKQK